jgi:hypothetical protein
MTETRDSATLKKIAEKEINSELKAARHDDELPPSCEFQQCLPSAAQHD